MSHQYLANKQLKKALKFSMQLPKTVNNMFGPVTIGMLLRISSATGKPLAFRRYHDYKKTHNDLEKWYLSQLIKQRQIRAFNKRGIIRCSRTEV